MKKKRLEEQLLCNNLNNNIQLNGHSQMMNILTTGTVNGGHRQSYIIPIVSSLPLSAQPFHSQHEMFVENASNTTTTNNTNDQPNFYHNFLPLSSSISSSICSSYSLNSSFVNNYDRNLSLLKLDNHLGLNHMQQRLDNSEYQSNMKAKVKKNLATSRRKNKTNNLQIGNFLIKFFNFSFGKKSSFGLI
jgi:hypothetical protein